MTDLELQFLAYGPDDIFSDTGGTPPSEVYTPDPNSYGDPIETTPYDVVQPVPYEIPSESLGPLAKQYGVDYVVPERKMNIIKENPYIAPTPVVSGKAQSNIDVPWYIDAALGAVTGGVGNAWTGMRWAQRLNNWWSKR